MLSLRCRCRNNRKSFSTILIQSYTYHDSVEGIGELLALGPGLHPVADVPQAAAHLVQDVVALHHLRLSLVLPQVVVQGAA